MKAFDFFQLFFTREMVESIVLHTNTYAHIQIASGGFKSYPRSGESWEEATSDDIHRLIALLIYFGLVKVVGDVSKYWSTASLFHGLWSVLVVTHSNSFILPCLFQITWSLFVPSFEFRICNLC